MKKIFLTILTLSIIALATAEITHQKMLKLVSKGQTIQNIPLASVDYVDVFDAPIAPENLQADVINGQIHLNWDEVDAENVTYSVYRSSDDFEYTLLISGLHANCFTDISPLKGRCYYKVSASYLEDEGCLSESLEVVNEVRIMEPGLYVGIIGYNDGISSSRFANLDDSFASYLNTYAYNLELRSGSALYSAMNVALDSIQRCDLPEDLNSIYIVGITSAPNNTSLKPNNPIYENIEKYREILADRIKSESKDSVAIKSYMLGLIGDENSLVANQISDDVHMLSSASENATLHTSLEDLNGRLQEIADMISSENSPTGQDMNLRLSGCPGGAKIRITFDRAFDAEASEYYLEATIDAESADLVDIKCTGLTSSMGEKISGKRDGMYMSYSFKNLSSSTKGMIMKNYCDVWIEDRDKKQWKKNNTFEWTDTDYSISKKSAMVWLVMDCSSSMKQELSLYKAGIGDFINILNHNCGSDADNSPLEGVIGRKDINNILFIGSSFINHGISDKVGWAYDGGMAPSIPDHSLPRLITQGIQAYYPEVTASYLSSIDWERNYDDFDFEANWSTTLKSLTPDAIYLHISGNSEYGDSFPYACEKLISTLKAYCPDAEIYLAASWHGGIKAQAFKKACDENRISYVDLSQLKTADNMWRAGDWYYSDEDSAFYPITEFVCTHPNDVGCLMQANEYLKASGYKRLNMLHNITVSSHGEGFVSTPAAVWPENGVVTLRIETGTVKDIQVTTSSKEVIEATFRSNNLNPNYSDYCTFVMPKEDVMVDVIFSEKEDDVNNMDDYNYLIDEDDSLDSLEGE